MTRPSDSARDIPARAGVGLKAEHYEAILGGGPRVAWFEIHAENYMGEGGPPHHYLARIRADHPISLHGVGLSIGSEGRLDRDHLARLRTVAERYEPGLFSEHLAWSTHSGRYFPDLLPLPYTDETLGRVCDHIDEVQAAMGRQMLLENPSTYLEFATATIPETEFIAEIARRTGCGLLLDVNNVFVSAANHGTSADAYLDAFPLAEVGEIHLAGHAEDSDGDEHLLIDAHDRPVAGPVWELYARVVRETGPLPTLIEWDTDVPDWETLAAEAARAERWMEDALSPEPALGHG